MPQNLQKNICDIYTAALNIRKFQNGLLSLDRFSYFDTFDSLRLRRLVSLDYDVLWAEVEANLCQTI